LNKVGDATATRVSLENSWWFLKNHHLHLHTPIGDRLILHRLYIQHRSHIVEHRQRYVQHFIVHPRIGVCPDTIQLAINS
jgi:hypothetical protein